MVYNCNAVPALCNAAAKKLGPTVTTTALVYDRWRPPSYLGGESRTDERRRRACGAGVQLQCPAEADPINGQEPQPASFTAGATTRIGGWIRTTPTVYPATQLATTTTVKAGVTMTLTSPNQLATIVTSKSGRQEQVRLPYLLSCDEFPPATSIQGGSGAESYCVPIRDSSYKRRKGFSTEQNWQGHAIGAVRLVAENTAKGANPDFVKKDFTKENTLFEWHFKMTYSDGVGAVWVEAGGEVRYCYGPWGEKNLEKCRGTIVLQTLPMLRQDEEFDNQLIELFIPAHGLTLSGSESNSLIEEETVDFNPVEIALSTMDSSDSGSDIEIEAERVTQQAGDRPQSNGIDPVFDILQMSPEDLLSGKPIPLLTDRLVKTRWQQPEVFDLQEGLDSLARFSDSFDEQNKLRGLKLQGPDSIWDTPERHILGLTGKDDFDIIRDSSGIIRPAVPQGIKRLCLTNSRSNVRSQSNANAGGGISGNLLDQDFCGPD
ncbi:hypothetical protein TWF696_007368 [Orbilia brochopaga]|uniref:Deoxyribonuclease NucA/NucB domain-containing protein n=1 Tax=Orbilia brochopaga TaxID=3140254 RepID=A0AAV9US56_9PEZI